MAVKKLGLNKSVCAVGLGIKIKKFGFVDGKRQANWLVVDCSGLDILRRCCQITLQ